MKLTCLLADDEPVLRYHLQKQLEDLWPELDEIISAANGDEAWTLIQELRPQVVFLDIRMPGLNGLEVAAKMQQAGLTANCRVVFLTAYDQYALEAFEREAMDYLLKPVDEKRLLKCINRLQQQLQQTRPQLVDLQQLQQLLHPMDNNLSGTTLTTTATRSPLKWLNALKGEDIHVIDIDRVLVFQAEDKYTRIITTDGDYLIRTSLKQLEQQLNPDQFRRIHRSSLIQLSAIEKITRSLTGQWLVTLRGIQKPLQISRRFADQFKQH
ncbi:MAG: response regulator transcription factor [Marinospirillum sp.]|uniref:LytR/AlgR family response regulator transcription factor n=1 Tax=Marinospirillum sp. TaxID=2183934 RepID=UPI0019EA2520|nr:LytTR family DNA-binding domain-containing protein [Marinospirillum sp.]MBE0506532.1 response regulator transcription factor [Marinospirillum sp.]